MEKHTEKNQARITLYKQVNARTSTSTNTRTSMSTPTISPLAQELPMSRHREVLTVKCHKCVACTSGVGGYKDKRKDSHKQKHKDLHKNKKPAANSHKASEKKVGRVVPNARSYNYFKTLVDTAEYCSCRKNHPCVSAERSVCSGHKFGESCCGTFRLRF